MQRLYSLLYLIVTKMADTPAAKALLKAVYLTIRLLLSPFRKLLWFLCITIGTVLIQCSDLVALTRKKYHHKQYVRYRVPPLIAPYYPPAVSVDQYHLSSMVGGRPRKVLVLDLDETLIHSYHDAGVMKLQRPPYPPDFTFRVLIDRHHVRFNVHKRPHVDFFLNVVKHWFDLVVFTASMEVYGSAVADRLGQEFFMKRLYRQHCTTSPSCGGLTKNLSIICADLSSIMIIDNSPLAYKDFPANAIPITSWYYDPSDTELLALLPVLDALRFVNDVRTVLGRKNRSSYNSMSSGGSSNATGGSNVLMFGTNNPVASQLVIRADPDDCTITPDIVRCYDNNNNSSGSNGDTGGNHVLNARALAAGAV